jgi:SAM-dependent methyltransferase
MTELFPEFFRRHDERPDAVFYETPREGSHIDDRARAAAREWYRTLMPAGGHVLDLLAGIESHLPEHLGHVVGLGLNAEELRRNPRVDEAVIQDVNSDPALPFGDGRFDGAVCTVSVQYLTRPVALFGEVARVLKPDAPFVVAFSTRMFPTKAVLAWRASDDAAHHRLVRCYLNEPGRFGPAEVLRHVPEEGDPLYALVVRRTAER